MSKFTSCQNKGFFMEFENGFRISVQWGIMNYCQRKYDGEFDAPQKEDYWESTSCEIAVFDKANNMIDIKGDDYDVVVGWLSTDQVAKVIAVVQSAKTVDEIKLKCQSLNL